jgi:hypothetical protein
LPAAGHVTHVVAAAAPAYDHAATFERLKSLAYDRAADSELPAEVLLGGESVALSEAALADLGLKGAG